MFSRSLAIVPPRATQFARRVRAATNSLTPTGRTWDRWLAGDLVWLMLGGAATVAAQLAILSIIHWRWDEGEVAAYGTIRRWASVAQPLLALGTLTMLPTWGVQGRMSQAVIAQILRGYAGLVVLVVGFAWWQPDLLERILFGSRLGDAVGPDMRWGMVLLVTAHGANGLAYALYQGRGWFRAYGQWQAVVFGVWPVAVAAWAPGLTEELVVTASGYAVAATWMIRRAWAAMPRRAMDVPRLLLGLRRIPAEIGVPFLITVPAMVATQEFGRLFGGRLAWIGIGLAALGTVTVVLHLRVTRYVAGLVHMGRVATAHRRAAWMIHRVATWGWWSGVGLASIAAGIGWWRQEGIAQVGAQALQWLAVGPYLTQLVARRFVDGLEERPLVLVPVAWGGLAGLVIGLTLAPWVGLTAAACAGALVAYEVMARGMRHLAVGDPTPFPWLARWWPELVGVARDLGRQVGRPMGWARDILRAD